MKIRHTIGALGAVPLLFIAPTVLAASISGQGTWESTLQPRDLDGNLATFEAYYDTAYDITWLADASYAKTSGYDADGFMTWSDANAWAAGLNPYGSGITGWRLPNTVSADYECHYAGVGFGFVCGFNPSGQSDMTRMHYVTLGNGADLYGSYTPGFALTNTGPFSNLMSGIYWSATTFGSDPAGGGAWFFDFAHGQLEADSKSWELRAWAVHDGDAGTVISSVPLPPAIWFFGSGLVGLLGVARRHKKSRNDTDCPAKN